MKILIDQKIWGFVKHLGEMNNNTLTKQALILSEELRSKKQVCFLTNIDKILKSYDIYNSINDFQFLSAPSIKQHVTKMKTSYVNLWRASKQNTRKVLFSLESLFKFAIKVKFFDVASSSFQNCKYLFSIFLIISGIVLALMGSVVYALTHAVSRRNDFSSKMYDFRCFKACSFEIITIYNCIFVFVAEI